MNGSNKQLWAPSFAAVRVTTDAPGSTTFRHAHHYVQAGYILSGILTIELDAHCAFEVGVGEFFYLAARQPHVIAVRHPADVRSIDLRFKARPFFADARFVNMPGIVALSRIVNETFKLSAQNAAPLRPILRNMLALAERPDDIRLFLLRARLLQLAELSAHRSRRRYRRFPAPAGECEAVRSALDYIHVRFRTCWTLVELAQSVHLSTAYFSRLFRKTVGISPKQYLIRYRVERAKQLLMINPEHLPIKAIAAQSGFASPEQFTRTFHRMVGCAPHEFVS